MVKMVALARTKDEREAESKAMGGAPMVGDDGIHIHLEDHHLKKLGLHGNVEAGHEVHIRARGKVHHSSTSKSDGEKKRKSLSVHLSHMGIAERSETPEDERAESPSEERKELRAGIEKAHDSAEKRRAKA